MVVQVKNMNEKTGDLVNRKLQEIDATKTDPKDALFQKLRDVDDPELREIAIVGKKELLKTNVVIDQLDPALYLKEELYKRMSDEPDTFEWIQSALGDGIWYYDMEHGAQWYSPDFKKLFGYEDHEVPNEPSWWQENIFPEDLTRAMELVGEHIKTGCPYDQIVRYRHKDGSTVWVRCHGKAFFNNAGVPIRMLGAHNDLTALMKVQEELKMKESILDLLCTTSLDGYWNWNVKTGDHFMSVRWKTILGYDDSELRNRIETWWSLLLVEDAPKLHDAIERHKKDGNPLSVVLRYRRKDGTVAYMLTQGVAQKDNAGEWTHIFGTHTDVSYLEETRAVREASAAKSTFLATMSHEIRTPLNAVLGMAQVLMTTELTEEQLDCVNTLHNSGAHLLSLINDILDFSQIESGVVRMTTEDIDVELTIRNVLDVLQYSAQQKNVTISFNSRLPIGSKFRGDSERMRQIVFNLVGNAVKFTSMGCVSVGVIPERRHGNSGILLIVKDTGCGIASDQLTHIFDDFRQANNAIRSEYGGSGLGLSICKKLVEAKGGIIEVESEPGKGSIFSVWLPGLELSAVASSTPDTATPEVLLFEELIDESGSVMDRIQNAGFKVHKVHEECKETLCCKDFYSVIIHIQGPIVSDCLADFVGTILVKTNLQIFDVGRKARSIISEHHKSRHVYVPLFATSEEFRLALSTRESSWSTKQRSNRAIKEQPSEERRIKVMVAEDNLINQKVMKRLLSRCHCDVEIANNGVEAVKLASEQKWDVILMDLQMPVMDGLEATRLIREVDKATAIVALTANATTDDRDGCYDAGMNEFVTKPVSLETLRQVLARYGDPI